MQAEARLTHVPPGSYYFRLAEFGDGVTVTSHKSVFAFEVRSCYDVSVLLSNGTQNTYLVSIGVDNYKVAIASLTGGPYVRRTAKHSNC